MPFSFSASVGLIWSLEASLVSLVVMLPCLVSKRRFVGSSMAFVWGDVAWHASRDIRTRAHFRRGIGGLGGRRLSHQRALIVSF